MSLRLRSLRGRLLPQGWRDLIRQLLLFGAAYLLYDLVRGAANGKSMTVAAFNHARELIAVERTLHFFVEPSVQTWASGSHLLMAIATWLYLNAQTTILIGVLLYLYVARNRSFYFVRNMLAAGFALGLVGYVLYPTAPPRFLPEWGFFDTIADIAHIPQSSTVDPSSAFFNPYAAIPSMHVACALMIGWPLAKLVRWRVARAWWWAYPGIITFVTVVTANHFIADALLGALTAAISACVATWLGRFRPRWRFEALPATPEQALRAPAPAPATAT
jgi:hypothetical protein